MKTIGQTYPLSEFEPGDVGEFVAGGSKFVLVGGGKLVYGDGSGTDIDDVWRLFPTIYVGRGRYVPPQPSRIVMEDA